MLSESLKTLSIANIFEKLHQVKVLFHCGTIKWLTKGLIEKLSFPQTLRILFFQVILLIGGCLLHRGIHCSEHSPVLLVMGGCL